MAVLTAYAMLAALQAVRSGCWWLQPTGSTGNNAFLNRCKGRILGILDTQFPVFQFCLCCCTDLQVVHYDHVSLNS